MTVLINDLVIDQALNYIKNTVTEVRVCSGDPADRATAVTNTLAVKTGLTSTDFTGPANGDVSGRKITANAHSAVSITATGLAAVVCYCSGTDLLWKTNLSATQNLTSGGTVDISLVDHEIADAT